MQVCVWQLASLAAMKDNKRSIITSFLILRSIVLEISARWYYRAVSR